MKTLIYFTVNAILISTFFYNVQAQKQERSVINDAIALKKIGMTYDSLSQKITMNSNMTNEWEQAYKILINYSEGKEKDAQEIHYSFESNNFILVHYTSSLSKKKIESGKSLFSFPSLDITNFAFGLTDFLIERTKTELNIAFFERFKDEMTKDEYKDLSILFPQTFQMLTVIGDQMYYYNNYIQGLRHAFETDLSRMPYKIRTWVDSHKESIDITVYNTISIGLATTTSIIENKHPGAILKDLSTELKFLVKDNNEANFKALENIIHLVALISESFRDTQGADDYWVSGSKIRQLTNDDVLLRIYLGLLSQQIKLDSANLDIVLSKDVTLLSMLDTIGNNWSEYSPVANSLMLKFSSHINMTQNSVARFKETKRRVNANDELSNRERNSEMFNAYFDVTNSMLDILRNIGLGMNEFAENINRISPKVGSDLQTIFSKNNLRTIDDLYISKIEATYKIGVYAFNKQYAGLVSQTFLILSNFQKESKDFNLGKLKKLPFPSKTTKIDAINYKELLKSLKSLDIKESVKIFSGDEEIDKHLSKIVTAIDSLNEEFSENESVKIKDIGKNIDKLTELIKCYHNDQWRNFLKYGTFMANIVTADSPESATSAIEAVASPPGSYSIKRHSTFSVALNGYLGVFGGQEFIKGLEKAYNASITAPVGISFNWKRNKVGLLQTGLFVSVIDLGVITNYRLTETNNISSVPKVQLKNIVSPGLFLEWRLGKSPLTLGAGGQFGPQIREQNIIDDQSNVTGQELISQGLYWRAGVSLKVDIPILYFKQ